MADLSVSSAVGSTQQSQQGQWSQAKSLFDQLGKALQSGDLAGAQMVYTTLQQNAPQGTMAQVGRGNFGPSPFAALGQALQAGNLSGAQQAYAQIQQARGNHRHYGAQGNTNTTTDTEITASVSPSGSNGMIGTNINVTT
jgi:hypothetical protein